MPELTAWFLITTLLSGASTGEQAPQLRQDSFRLRLFRSQLLLASGHAEPALVLARELNREAPDDLDGYAAIVDAARVLGRRDEALRAAQWMLDLRADDIRGLLRAAALREDDGDFAGAIVLLSSCYHRTTANPQMRAAILTDLARLFSKTGKPEQASRLLEQATKLRTHR